MIAGQPADRRQEVAIRIFRIEAAFDRPAVELDVGLSEGQLLAAGNTDHLLDEVEAGDQFGDRVFDLEAGVHFQEVELVLLAIDNELDRAGGVVADRLGERHGLFAHGLSRGFVEEGRGGFLDDLLVAALDRAFAFAEIEHGSVLVAEHLYFDVARLGDELLDEDAVVAERVLGFVARGLEAFAGFLGIPGDAHALAAAAGGGLDHDRITDLVGDLHGLVGILDQAHVARNRGDAGFGGELLGGDLVTHGLDRADRRADEGDAFLGERICEDGVFRQEAVARMDGIGAGLADRLEDLLDDDIGLVGRGRADMNGLVGHLHMQRVTVGVRIDGDGLDAHLLGGLDDPAGDFATIGDQQFLDCHRHTSNTSSNDSGKFCRATRSSITSRAS